MAHTLNIIGPGRVGRALGALLQRAGSCAVQDVLSAETATAEAAVAFIGAGRAVRVLRDMRAADLWLLTPPDAAIAPVAAALAAAGCVRKSDITFHCSGALSSAVLAPLAAAGAKTASVHPLKSFADPAMAVQTFSGTYCAVEGDPAALAVLTPLFERLGARVSFIDPAGKTLYHAASVLVCNDLTALMEAGLRAYEGAGIERATAQAMMEPLVRETIDNIFALGTTRALTGPVARGDAGTVAAHIAELRQVSPQALGAYVAMARLTADRALAAGMLRPDAAETLLDVLAEESR